MSTQESVQPHAPGEIAATHRIGILRARLLPAGTAIIAALRAAAGADELVLTAVGLRDGVLIEFFERGRSGMALLR